MLDPRRCLLQSLAPCPTCKTDPLCIHPTLTGLLCNSPRPFRRKQQKGVSEVVDRANRPKAGTEKLLMKNDDSTKDLVSSSLYHKHLISLPLSTGSSVGLVHGMTSNLKPQQSQAMNKQPMSECCDTKKMIQIEQKQRPNSSVSLQATHSGGQEINLMERRNSLSPKSPRSERLGLLLPHPQRTSVVFVLEVCYLMKIALAECSRWTAPSRQILFCCTSRSAKRTSRANPPRVGGYWPGDMTL